MQFQDLHIGQTFKTHEMGDRPCLKISKCKFRTIGGEPIKTARISTIRREVFDVDVHDVIADHTPAITHDHKYIYAEDESGNPTEQMIAIVATADPVIAQKVLDAHVDQGNEFNGRSEFKWIRLQNGDLILGVYPRGDTYFETEIDPNRP